ncbi:MAG: ISL3 family transposase [Propionibacteriaceae bacterium]
MYEPTCPQRDAASVIFDLPGYTVLDGLDLPGGGRRVVVQAVGRDEGCPDCGVVSARVHAWTRQRVKDIGAGGDGTATGGRVEVVVRKPRMVCAEQRCPRKTFTQTTDQLPARARCLTRLRTAVLEAVLASGRAVEEVAGSFAVAWWTVQAAVLAAVMTLPDVDDLPVRFLGIDEHRFRTVRWFRDPDTDAWHRVEPWMTTFVDLRTGQVIGVVDGRHCGAVTTWLDARSEQWRQRVEVVAMDPSATYRSAIGAALPEAQVSVDHWHLVRLANLMVTAVRQRVAREWLGRRGRASDGAWAHRMLLLRAGNTLTDRAWDRLDRVFTHDDPTGELGATWGVKERLRQLLACTDLDTADHARGLLGITVLAADTDECWKPWATINHWWNEIKIFIETRITNAKTEAANTSIKQIKRTGRRYRNHHHYQARILLTSAHRHGRRSPLTQQATTANCG